MPNGYTSLMDAMGESIDRIELIHNHIRVEDIPEKTIFVIQTDGEENSSRKYTSDEIKRKVERIQKEKSWEFIFLGANIDAVETAKSYGISEHNAKSYSVTIEGVAESYEIMYDCIRKI